MVRVAMTSDNHFDVNRVDSNEMLKYQAEYLVEHHAQYYLIAGDLFNDFENSIAYVERLQLELGNAVVVRWIAGNHDMLHGVTYEQLEGDHGSLYLHRGSEDVMPTNWRIIGNNGWYDYSLAEMTAEHPDFHQWKQAYWVDGIIKQPMTDPQRMDVVLAQLKQQLRQAQIDNKQVLVMTHFAPRKEYIQVHPEIRMWNMSNAMMGSKRLGELLEQYHVKKVLFGHLHLHVDARTFGPTTYYNQAVGYGRHKHNEWYADNFFDQWRQQLEFLNLG